jgi:hypothetical protein
MTQVARFIEIAAAAAVKTVSLFSAPANADRICVGDTIFPIEHGTVLLPDFLGQQLELAYLGKDEHVAAFDVIDGKLALVFFDGKGPQSAPADEQPPLDPTHPKLAAAIAELQQHLAEQLAGSAAPTEPIEPIPTDAPAVEPMPAATVVTTADDAAAKGSKRAGRR